MRHKQKGRTVANTKSLKVCIAEGCGTKGSEYKTKRTTCGVCGASLHEVKESPKAQNEKNSAYRSTITEK